MKDKIATKNAKCEIIKIMWDRVYFQLFYLAGKYKDDGMKAMLSKIAVTPKAVIDELLKQYINKCK